MKYWKQLDNETLKERVFRALEGNVNYYKQNVLGVPASHLDDKVFNIDAGFLKDAPFMSTLVHNPNHIGVHTTGTSESFFRGTQELERELIELVGVDILHGEPNTLDGYVASGGTEANIQAIWIYRNEFHRKDNVPYDKMVILTGSDAHYSMAKAANVLGIEMASVEVDNESRTFDMESVLNTVNRLKDAGKTHFIGVANMMTTMFGSVDNPDDFGKAFEQAGVTYRIHIDGAYGGFYYPFSNEDFNMNFANPYVSSVTLDAHKMVQAPYGTGIFVCRKGLIENANTEEASYVEGTDYTLIGSRSGANAIAIWMILMTYGPYGWREKVLILQNRADWMCDQLKSKNIAFFRDPFSNIITIRAHHMSRETAKEFGLVPDNHQSPNWYKIVIMDHVTIEKLIPLLEKL